MKKPLLILFGCFLIAANAMSQVATNRSKTFSFSRPSILRLEVISPKNNAEFTSTPATVKGVAIHSLKLVDFRINGVSTRSVKIVATGRKQNLPDTTLFSCEVPLQLGANRIRLEVINSAGETTSRELVLRVAPPATPPAPFSGDLRPIRQNHAYAVIIGVADYADPAIRDLRYTVNDARAIYELLIDPRYGDFKPENVKLLLDQEATAKNIKSAIGSWLPKVTPEDATVVIFFAGHGAPEGKQTYWLTHDAEPNDLFSTALSNNDIAEMLSRVKSERVLTFLDCCYSAATINRTIATRAPAVEDPFQRFKGKGRIIITASDGKQESLEDANLQHGIFTYRLVEALKGRADKNRDGVVVVLEALEYVQSHVQADAQFRGYVQQPTFSGEFKDIIAISRNYELVLQRDRDRQKEKFLALYRNRQIDGAMYQRIVEAIDAPEDEKSSVSTLEMKRRVIRDFLDEKIKLPVFIELFGK